MKIIGSKAIKHWFPLFNREPKDIDVVINEDNYIDKKDSITIEYLKNPVLLKYGNFIETDSGLEYLRPEHLLTLKMSHIFWDKNWDKHMYDIQYLIKEDIEYNKDLFYLLYEYWNETLGKNKRSDLEMSSDEFFNNAVSFNKDYNLKHDYLHTVLIKHPYFCNQKEPTYTYILKENEEVDVCMKKFQGLNYHQKYNLTFEEVAIMSIEGRFKQGTPVQIMYKNMLKKFIMNHCKIEQAIWIILNYNDLLNYPFDYKNFLEKQLKIKL